MERTLDEQARQLPSDAAGPDDHRPVCEQPTPAQRCDEDVDQTPGRDDPHVSSSRIRRAEAGRVDAHATVPADYVRNAVERLGTGRWGGVGGRKDGIGQTPAGRAVAAAMASRFGVGGSTYHHGTAPKAVSHIPFGAYPTLLARRLGGWDPRLVVNQDYEFDHRVREAGYELLFDPALVIAWHCRQSVRELFQQYRRYGRGKVDVLRLHPESALPRQLLPAGLVAAWVLAPPLARRWPWFPWMVYGPYAAGLTVASVLTARRLDGAAARAFVPGAFLALHVGWGVGLWEGVIAHLAGRRRL